MKAKDLLVALINASEKAANIARKCRSNQHLFSLLIEEKTGDEKVNILNCFNLTYSYKDELN